MVDKVPRCWHQRGLSPKAALQNIMASPKFPQIPSTVPLHSSAVTLVLSPTCPHIDFSSLGCPRVTGGPQAQGFRKCLEVYIPPSPNPGAALTKGGEWVVEESAASMPQTQINPEACLIPQMSPVGSSWSRFLWALAQICSLASLLPLPGLAFPTPLLFLLGVLP